eukprot:3938923-Rhodomonas_salina.2
MPTLVTTAAVFCPLSLVAYAPNAASAPGRSRQWNQPELSTDVQPSAAVLGRELPNFARFRQVQPEQTEPPVPPPPALQPLDVLASGCGAQPSCAASESVPRMHAALSYTLSCLPEQPAEQPEQL